MRKENENLLRWSVVSLLFAIAICSFRWAPFAGVVSLLPLIGYLLTSKFGKKGVALASCSLLGVGIPCLFREKEPLFLSLFLGILFVSYLLFYLEQESAREEIQARKEKENELHSDLEKWKKMGSSLRTSLIEIEEKVSEEKNSLHQEIVELQNKISFFREQYDKLHHEFAQKQQEWEQKYTILSAESSSDKSMEVGDSNIRELGDECERLEKEIDTLQELVSLLVPFGRTQLSR